mgnify:CR=1 FL=1
MHKVIRLIVIADEEETAIEEAKEELDSLIERNESGFDYGGLLTEKEEDGTLRSWGYEKGIYNLTEEKGIEILLNGLKYDYEYFLENYDRIKKNTITDELELYNNSGSILYSYQSLGVKSFVFFENSGVNADELNLYLKGHDPKRVWVVLADVHF